MLYPLQKGVPPKKGLSEYDSILHPMVKLHFWISEERGATPSLPLLPDPL